MPSKPAAEAAENALTQSLLPAGKHDMLQAQLCSRTVLTVTAAGARTSQTPTQLPLRLDMRQVLLATRTQDTGQPLSAWQFSSSVGTAHLK